MESKRRAPARPVGPPGGWARARRWARSPMAVLAAAAVAAVLCGVVLHPKGLVAAAGLAAVMGVGAIWPFVAVAGLRGELGFDRARGREGRPVRATLGVRNRAPWGAWGLEVREEVGGTLQAAVGHVAGGRRSEVSWEFVPDRRGEYPLGGAALVTGFPFGLATARKAIGVGRPLVVWPATFPVPLPPDLAGGPRREGSSPRAVAGDEGEVMGVRDYRRGDAVRRVHWPQTARQGRLIVRELESSRSRRVQVVLDLDAEAHSGSTLDWAVRVAASFVEAWTNEGVAVELVAGEAGRSRKAGPGEAVHAPLMDILAGVTAGPGPALAEILAGPACRAFREGTRVVVTTEAGAGRAGSPRPGRVAERFVVLSATGFGGPPGGPGASRPWIWIEGPEAISDALGRAGRGVSNAG